MNEGKHTRKKRVWIAVGVLLSICLAGCGREPKDDGKLRIVTTTTMLYDMTAFLAGEHASVTALMGPGVDPHLYQASAGDVRKMQDAQIVVYNGVHLEGKMGDVFAQLDQQGHRIICAEDGIRREMLLADENHPEIHDPHVWFDVPLWMDAAKYTAQKLGEYDPEHRQDYERNLNVYLDQLQELDTYIRKRVQELPETSRVLVTAHDAFRYFGKAYGFQVKGLQGISTDAEAGTADVSALAEFIAERKIKAIFVESSVPPKNIQALQAAVQARGFDVSIGGELYSDSLGDEASGCSTYVSTCKANIDTIVDALK